MVLPAITMESGVAFCIQLSNGCITNGFHQSPPHFFQLFPIIFTVKNPGQNICPPLDLLIEAADLFQNLHCCSPEVSPPQWYFPDPPPTHNAARWYLLPQSPPFPSFPHSRQGKPLFSTLRCPAKGITSAKCGQVYEHALSTPPCRQTIQIRCWSERGSSSVGEGEFEISFLAESVHHFSAPYFYSFFNL